MPTKTSKKLEKAHTTLALEHLSVGLQLDKANARIAELTAKYDSLEKSWIEGSSAHQETIEHLETVRDSYDRCYVENERLIDEVKHLRGALVRICEAFGDIRTSADNSRFAMEQIARNALKRD